MALVATYGNVLKFNIKIYDLAGGGYYCELHDVDTKIFKIRASSVGEDTNLHIGASHQWFIDRFTSYSYDAPSSTLTLSGCSDTYLGVTFTRVMTFKFVGDYIIENKFTVLVNGVNASFSETHWAYYDSIDKVWDVGNSNFGDGVSTNGLGIGVQLTAGGSVYGVISANDYDNKNCNKKRALASQNGIACVWITPDDAASLSVTPSVPITLTQWFFKSNNTQKDFIYKAQEAVWLAKSYSGTEWEKICKVTSYLNIGLTNDLTTVKLKPSTAYNTGMWARDSFFHSLTVPDNIEQSAIQAFENTQNVSGQIATTIFGDGTKDERHDESTLLHIIRAYYDQEVRGLVIDNDVLELCLDYINNNVTDGKYLITSEDTGTFQTWIDTFYYTENSVSAYLQGIYAVSLRCAKELGLNVNQSTIDLAITEYRNLYDSTNKYLKFASDKSMLAPDVLTPEALSIFLFNEKILTADIVMNTLDKLKFRLKTECGMKCLANLDGTFLTPENNDFLFQYQPGHYHNGASWFLWEYLAYYVGFHYGFSGAKSLAYSRINQELGREKTSHEFLQSKSNLDDYLSEDPPRHPFSWNVAFLTISLKKRQSV